MMAHHSASAEEEQDPLDGIDNSASSQMDAQLATFWTKILEDVQNVQVDDFKQQTLPLARIKKIMKLDEDVKMMSAEVPLLFAKACEIFIHELTLRAWAHTEDNKRRTLQRNDIAMAITKSDQFDFLIDIVPRYEMKPVKVKDELAGPRTPVNTEQVQYYLQLAQQHQAALQSPPTQQQQIQVLQTHQLQQLQQQQQQQQQQAQQAVATSSAATPIVVATSPTATAQTQASQSPQAVHIVQQVVTPNGEIQQIPIQLTQQQLNMIRMQLQNNPGQPIVLQPQQTPTQIIQVPQPQQQVYIAQVSQED